MQMKMAKSLFTVKYANPEKGFLGMSAAPTFLVIGRHSNK
jgi:hypothetical protein